MKKLIQRWLGLYVPDVPDAVSLTRSHAVGLDELVSTWRVELIPATNGRILRLGTYKFNPHGPDWAFTLYVIPDDQSLPDAIATCLVLTDAGRV